MIYGAASYRRLSTCEPRLQVLMVAAAADFDFIVTCGHRGEKEQNEAVANGRSRVRWPNGAHNSLPSKAVDLAPFPVDWSDVGRFDRLGDHVLRIARDLQIPIAWGGHWKTLVDRPHFQLAD